MQIEQAKKISIEAAKYPQVKDLFSKSPGVTRRIAKCHLHDYINENLNFRVGTGGAGQLVCLACCSRPYGQITRGGDKERRLLSKWPHTSLKTHK